MLTKDLLKFKIRAGTLYPEFLSPASEGPVKLATLLISGLENARGLSRAELERNWDESGADLFSWSGGFRKLLLDRIEWEEPEENWPEKRLEILLEAQSLRLETLFTEKEAFQESMASLKDKTYPELARELYKDLPEERPVKTIPDTDPVTLINRYNCSMAQSLLLRSSKINLKACNLSLMDKRMLFQSIRFHQLVAFVSSDPENSKEINLSLSGPLSVFEGAQTYGLKLANFFPRILLLKNWELSAEIDAGPGKKNTVMELSHESGLVSHYRAKSIYIPEEFGLFRTRFNQESPDWKVREAGQFVHIGSQSYCFPDMEFFREGSKEVIGLELFHRWHQGNLSGRLKALRKNPARNLLLGVSRQLIKKAELKKLVEESEWFQAGGFLFKDFPTVKSVLGILNQRGSL